MNRVLVSLDALLDTRIATISQIDSEAAVKLVDNPAYYERRTDDFTELCGIGREQFKDAYARRNKATLQKSLITHIPFMLDELICRLEEQEDGTPYQEGLGLDVNIWPYVELSESERNMLINAVMARAGRQTIPNIVCIPPEQLTPSMVKTTYSGLILYDFRDWFQHHMQMFQAVPCPRTTVLTPALFHDRIPEPEEYLEEGMRKDVSPFELMRFALLECFGAEFLKPTFFSLYRPEYDIRFKKRT